MGWAALGHGRPSTSPEGNRPPANRSPANSYPSQYASPDYLGQFGPQYPSDDSFSSPEYDSRRPRRHSSEISYQLRDAVQSQTLGMDMSGRPRRRRHTYEVGVIAPGGTMTRADRNQAMEFRQGILENLAYGNKFGEYAAAPHLDSSFGSNVTKRRERAATFGSEARGAVTMQQIPEGPSSTSGHAHQLYRRGDTNVTAYFGHTVWGASKEDGSVPDATAAARAARNGAPRLRPPPFKLPDDPRYRPVKAVINASRAVDMMAKLAGVQKRAGAVEGDLLAEATRNAGGAGGGNPFAVGGGGNRFLAKFAAKAGGGAAAAAAPAKLFAAAAAAPPQAEALNMHMSMHMPENQPPFGVPPPYAPQPFGPSAFAPPAPPPAFFPMGSMGMFPPPPGAPLPPPGALTPPLPPPPPPGFAQDWPLERWQAWHAERGIVPPPGLWEHYARSSG
jgi:hypothetical protein